MRYRRPVSSGLQVAEISLGSWLTFGKQIGDPTAKRLRKTAYDKEAITTPFPIRTLHFGIPCGDRLNAMLGAR
jgi:hypothetical protein